MFRISNVAALAAVLVAAAGCGGDPQVACDPAAQTGCGGAQVCEAVEGGTPACFDPVVVTGTVTDLTTSRALDAARLVALDANGAAASNVASSAADGSFRIVLPRRRAADGTPVAGAVTLRAERAGYQSFPGGVRPALPIDVSSPERLQGSWTVRSALTNVGLAALPAGAGTASIHGRVPLPIDRGGVLVVAESSSGSLHGGSAVADSTGSFALFNLDEGAYTVKAYARGQNYTPVATTLALAHDTEVVIASSGAPTATVTGNVIVNSSQGSALTSVILVVKSTFDARLARGDAPPGLRAPGAGAAPDVTGAFSIAGVPDGEYVALAGFEDDGLVRNPNPNLGNTGIAGVTVAGGVVSGSPQFKLTDAIALATPDQVRTVTPSFTWQDVSNEDRYVVSVLDSFGNTTWETTVDRTTSGVPTIDYPAAATALAPGMYYQLRVVALRLDSVGNAYPITRSEDLKGVFQYVPAA